MPRDSFITKVDARLASSDADNAANAGGRLSEEAIPAIQRLAAIARAYPRDLQQRGWPSKRRTSRWRWKSPSPGAAATGRSPSASTPMRPASAFLTGYAPYTRETGSPVLDAVRTHERCFEGKLEEFIEKVMDAELLAR